MKEFLKGQLHLHTNLSDGRNTPQEVLDVYKSCGYDFIVWSDHCKNVDINEYLTDSKGIVNIGGIEIDTRMANNYDPNDDLRDEFGNKCYLHANALGVKNFQMSYDVVKDSPSKTSERIIDEIVRNGGIPMINHPNWSFGLTYRHLLNINRDFFLEIGNCWDCDTPGNFAKESMESVWDMLLSSGKKIYGTATDDCHMVGEEYVKTTHASYNRGYVGVWAERNEESILQALRNGEFYASNGIDLEEYTVNDKSMNVKVKQEDDEKYIILFKGKYGMPLKTVYGTEGTYEFTGAPEEEYVRAKVISNKMKYCAVYLVENEVYYKGCYTQPYFRKN